MSDKVKIDYNGYVVYEGELACKDYISAIDSLLEDTKCRCVEDLDVSIVKSVAIIDASIGYYGWIVLVTKAIAINSGLPAQKVSKNYVYLAQGPEDTLNEFLEYIIQLGKAQNSWDFLIEEKDEKRTLYRGKNLALTECADKIYRDALSAYVKSAESIDKVIGRKVSVLESTDTSLVVEVRYNDVSVIYSLSGSVAYLYELDCYFRGVYEDFDKMLKEGHISSAYDCDSVLGIGQFYGIDIMSRIWIPFQMNGNLSGECITFTDENEIYRKAVAFCKISIPDYEGGTKISIKYVFRKSDKIVIKRLRDSRLHFSCEPVITKEPTTAIDVYAKVYVGDDLFITYRYFVQDKIPVD